MDPKVDEFIEKAQKWKSEIEALRTVVLSCGLSEGLKWRLPCYMYKGSNVAIIQPFKKYCALMFFKGVLLKDPSGILVGPGESSQAARQVRFTSVNQIIEKEAVLKAFIFEAVEVEKAGLKVELKKTEDFKIPEEFQNKLDEMPALKTAFEALTPGRQRAYLYYFSQAKLARTRESRVEKSIESILKGKGLNEG